MLNEKDRDAGLLLNLTGDGKGNMVRYTFTE